MLGFCFQCKFAACPCIRPRSNGSFWRDSLLSLGTSVTATKGGSFMCKCEFLQSFGLPGKVNMVACKHNAFERVKRMQAPTFKAVMTKSAS